MLNIIQSITNFTAYYPIKRAFLEGDLLTCSLIGFAATSSAISHLFESHKHNLDGFGTSPLVSYYLNRLDLVGVFGVSVRLLYLCYNSGLGYSLFTNNIRWFVVLFASYLCNMISEQDKGYEYFIIFHNIWHLSIFMIINQFLFIIYSQIKY